MHRLVILSIKGFVTAFLLADLGVFVIRYHLLGQPYMAAALMGSFVLFASSSPGKRQLAGALLLSAGFALTYGWMRHESLLSIYAAAFLGVGSLAIQGLALTWGQPQKRTDHGRGLLIGMILPAFLFCTGICLAALDQMNSKTYDHFLYVFDASLGFSPSFALGQLMAVHAPLRVVCYYAYEFLPLAMSIAFALDRKRSLRWSPNLLTLFVTLGVSGYIGYHLYPAAGPTYVWPGQFPWHPLPAAAVLLEKTFVADASRNAMPSLHLGMALVIWFASRGWSSWLRIASATLVFLTVLATLGFGEHYLIDLAVAVPLVVAAVAWSTSSVPLSAPARLTPLLGGASLTLAWIVLLRVGVPLFAERPLLSWSSVLFTVALPFVWEARLAQAAARSVPASDGRAETHAEEVPQPFGLLGARSET
ncbi:MAG: phosphatase PAP2 family protein [Acidobacteriia bacterium]|nr:phosphatase PAP2 family protein [Terriglobia bacterium]